jgi:hypothetical protein
MKYMARKYTFPSPSGKKPEPFKFSSPYPRRLRRFSVTEMNNILKRYRNKEPLRSIAEMYHSSPSSISELAKRSGLPRRKQGRYKDIQRE